MPIKVTYTLLGGKIKKLTCKLADAPNLKTDPASADADEGSTCHIINARDIAKLHDGKWISERDGETIYAE